MFKKFLYATFMFCCIHAMEIGKPCQAIYRDKTAVSTGDDSVTVYNKKGAPLLNFSLANESDDPQNIHVVDLEWDGPGWTGLGLLKVRFCRTLSGTPEYGIMFKDLGDTHLSYASANSYQTRYGTYEIHAIGRALRICRLRTPDAKKTYPTYDATTIDLGDDHIVTGLNWYGKSIVEIKIKNLRDAIGIERIERHDLDAFFLHRANGLPYIIPDDH